MNQPQNLPSSLNAPLRTRLLHVLIVAALTVVPALLSIYAPATAIA